MSRFGDRARYPALTTDVHVVGYLQMPRQAGLPRNHTPGTNFRAAGDPHLRDDHRLTADAHPMPELHEVIEWLTGFDENQLDELIDEKATIERFFQKARINPNAELITGVICGYRIEEIDNPLTRQVRYLDKLVDELAKGRKMAKILRDSPQAN